MIDESDLPDEMQTRPGARVAIPAEDAAARLSELGMVIARKREQAKEARSSSGIEEIWTACEQAYEGIDAANVHLYGKSRWAKPTSVTGPVTRQDSRVDDTKSTVFIPLTARYVDAAAAMVSEKILPVDGRAFKLGPTPVPDLVKAADDTTQVVDNVPGGTGQPLTREPTEQEQQAQAQQGAQPASPAQPGPDGQPAPAAAPSVPLTVKDLAQEKIDAVTAKAKKAEDRIYDWMVEAKYPLQMRKVVFDSSRIGVGVLKGPFPTQRKKRAVSAVEGGFDLTYEFKTAPDMRWVDPWNFFPDGACGEDIQDGDFCFERDYLSEGKLKALKNEKTSKGKPIYLSTQIDKVIAEGPDKLYQSERAEIREAAKKKRFAIWYFTGRLSREDLEAAGALGLEDLPDDVVECDALVTVVNDTVIRAVPSPMDSGSFGYRVLPWSRRPGLWAGKGVGEQVDVGQRVVNNSTRRMLENAGKSAGVQFVIDNTAIYPSDGVWSITPDKVWIKAPDATMDDVRKAFLSVAIANVTDQLMKIIQYGMQLAEEGSSIPLVTQGKDGETTPQTFGQADLQNTNAHTILRSKAYAVDDHITEPLVNDLYDWLLMDPSVPDDEKGDFDIDARGSIVMVERAIQEQFLMSQADLVKDPAFGINPKKWYAEVMKAKRLDVSRIEYSEQELADMAKKPVPESDRITAAKIMAGTKEKDIAARTDRDTQFVEAEKEKNSLMHSERMEELALRERLAMLDYANKRDMKLEDVKAVLANTSMKLSVQKDLSLAAHMKDLHVHHNPAAPQVLTPPTEPAGRAEAGQAFAE